MGKENRDKISKYIKSLEPVMINASLVSAQKQKAFILAKFSNNTTPGQRNYIERYFGKWRYYIRQVNDRF